LQFAHRFEDHTPDRSAIEIAPCKQLIDALCRDGCGILAVPLHQNGSGTPDIDIGDHARLGGLT